MDIEETVEPGRLIFESSNSLIYYKENSEYDSPVIIKVLRKQFPSPEKIIQFNNEYEYTRNLNIKGVRRAHSQDRINDRYALTLEYFDGIPLKKYFRENRVPLEEFLKIAIEIAGTLGELYQNNLIHKDINGANILINPDTQETRIIDFGISSRIDIRLQDLGNPENLEGTLAYISPEQTGRMNRVVDYRSDIYSLGATFYEILSGQSPFDTKDPLTLIYCHIAREAHPLHLFDADELPGRRSIPRVISDMVKKLMEKNAEDRYQSTPGLIADLDKCLSLLKAKKKIEWFPLAQKDHSERFQIPQKLYGREEEVSELLNSFERAASGESRTAIISGYSGVGKSSLVYEIHKLVTAKRGYFVSGKFDQFRRGTPFHAITMALNGFFRLILTEKPENLAKWKNQILRATGKNAKVLIELMPDLEHVLGPQPDVPDLPSLESRNRFIALFQKLFKVLASADHPLVLFLDDLQWADLSSFELMKSILEDTDINYILFIGAYRNNKLESAHALTSYLNKLEEERQNLVKITLENLNLTHINKLISETLASNRTPEKEISELSALVYDKSRGNPYFTSEFLKSLYKEGYLVYSQTAERWSWDIDNIKKMELSDNVVVLLTQKIQKLPEDTRRALQIAACIGNQFDIGTLAIILENSPRNVLKNIWQAINESIISPLDNNYKLLKINENKVVFFKFQHDRVQQAAYEQINSAERRAIHLRIGKLLYEKTPPEKKEEKLFDIIRHLNEGRELLTSQEEKRTVAELNLLAGKKAKTSTAYEQAKNFLKTSLSLFSEDSRVVNYDLWFDVHLSLAEIEYLNGNFERAREIYPILKEQAKTNLDKLDVYRIECLQNSFQSNYRAALDIQLEALELLGVRIPKTEEEFKTQINLDLDEIKRRLAGRKIADLLDHKIMEDESEIKIMEFLCLGFDSAYIQGEYYLPGFIASRMVLLSLKHGNSEISAFAYTSFGFFLCSAFANYDEGSEYGKLGLELSERFQNNFYRCRVLCIYTAFIMHWKESLKKASQFYEAGFQAGLESGDQLYGAFNLIFQLTDKLTRGENLRKIEEESSRAIRFFKKTNNTGMLTIADAGFLQAIENLTGRTNHRHTFDNNSFREAEYLETYKDIPTFLAYYYYARIRAAFLFDDPESVKIAQKKAIVDAGTPSQNKIPEAAFYAALIYLGEMSKTENHATKEEYVSRVMEIQKQFTIWGDNCPENYRHKVLLIRAERARTQGNWSEAMELYEESIESARKNEFISCEALAAELYGKFWLERKKEKFARLYLNEARYLYEKWGASEKVVYMEETYYLFLESSSPKHMNSETLTGEMLTSQSSGDASPLDLSTVLKASRAISREINLEKLLTRMMQIIIENAGARNGYIIFTDETNYNIQASITSDPYNIQIYQSRPLETFKDISKAIVHYTIRTGETVVLGDTTLEIEQDGRFSNDHYFKNKKTGSILCMGIRRKDEVIGALYLDNNLSNNVFTVERTKILNILLPQAVISLENAKLFSEAGKKQDELRAYNEELESFAYSVAHDLRTPLRGISGFSQILFDNRSSLNESQINEYLLKITRGAQRMADLMDALLKMSQIFRRELQLSRVDLGEIAYNSLEKIKTRDPQRNVELKITNPMIIEGDPFLLDIAIFNLIENAWQFTSEVEKPEIEFGCIRNENEPLYYVRDNGVGFDMTYSAKLYHPFEKLHEPKSSEGPGIGLAMAERIIRRHGGKLDAESRVGEGATFYFSL